MLWGMLRNMINSTYMLKIYLLRALINLYNAVSDAPPSFLQRGTLKRRTKTHAVTARVAGQHCMQCISVAFLDNKTPLYLVKVLGTTASS